MAIGATAVWEERSASGSDNNGGFFIPGSTGTDWSQQNSPQYALTGLTSAGAGNTILSAAAAADMVGNGAQVISGVNATTGFFQITSVVVGVSITFATNNAGASIATGVVASLVLNIGGALATMAKVLGTNALRPSNTVYCVGTFTITTGLACALVSSNAAVTQFIGYTTVRGDNGRATWTSATNSVNIINVSSGDGISLFNIVMSSTAGTRGHGILADPADCLRIRVVNCIVDGCNIGINGKRSVVAGMNGLFVENSEIKNCVAEGIYNTFFTAIFACFIHANGGAGFHIEPNANSWCVMDRSIFYSNGGSGAQIQNSAGNANQRAFVISNCIFSTNTGAGILGDGDEKLMLLNNIFDRNTTYGVDCGTSTGNPLTGQWNNAFYNNTTAARRNNADFPSFFNDITLSADPYTTVGTDFSLNSTAGGGAACKGAGFPGALIAGGTGFTSVGALDPTTGGGSTTIVIGRNVTNYLGEQGDF